MNADDLPPIPDRKPVPRLDIEAWYASLSSAQSLWQRACDYTNSVAGRWLASPTLANRRVLDAAFARESALYAAWGGPPAPAAA